MRPSSWLFNDSGMLRFLAQAPGNVRAFEVSSVVLQSQHGYYTLFVIVYISLICMNIVKL